ncbi:hypothetical protein MMC11_003930 [Xylographa trunciseda]|nr:hypothetical protein [Xylographa trunciseda]
MLPGLKTQFMKFRTTEDPQKADTPAELTNADTQMTRIASQTTAVPSQNTTESAERPNMPKREPPIGQTQTSTETYSRPTPTGKHISVITSTQSQWTNVAPQSMNQKMRKPEDMEMW